MKVGVISACLCLFLGVTSPARAYRIASEGEARARVDATRKIHTQGEPLARKEAESFQKRASQARSSYTPYFSALLKRGSESPENLLKKAQEQERAYWDSERAQITREESDRQRTFQRQAQDANTGVRSAIERSRSAPQKVARIVPVLDQKAAPTKAFPKRAMPQRQRTSPQKRAPDPTYELDGSEIPQYLEFPGKKSN